MSESQYRPVLERLISERISLHRADAEPVTGKLDDVGKHGCRIVQLLGASLEYVKHVFVAFADIRGVEYTMEDASEAQKMHMSSKNK